MLAGVLACSRNSRAMKHKVAVAVAIFEGALLLLVVGAWALDRAGEGFKLFGCGGKVYSTAISPGKKWVAYAFERDCGATTGFASFVIVRDAGSKLDLAADLKREEIVFQTNGDFHPRLLWTSAGNLRVAFAPGDAPADKQIGFQTVKAGNWRIQYTGLPLQCASALGLPFTSLNRNSRGMVAKKSMARAK